MASVRIEGWRPGFDKVGHTRVLTSVARLSLSEAKSVTDAVLERKPSIVAVGSSAEAEALAMQLQALGAEVRVVP
jgi:ribosomal protein L7/L12